MQGRINTSFATYQADLFESGLVAQIGPNAFALWSAIKAHADYQTGLAYPSIRRLMELTGLASATVQKCLHTLEDAKLLRSEVKGRSRYYIARERLDISLGSRVLCTVVVDYVPAKLRAQVQAVKEALESGKDDPEVFASVEIVPGAGFVWDSTANVLRGTVSASQMPATAIENHLGDLAPLIDRARRKALPKPLKK
jgi:DNA-binding transcriptional regulator YhcF (GntR family)